MGAASRAASCIAWMLRPVSRGSVSNLRSTAQASTRRTQARPAKAKSRALWAGKAQRLAHLHGVASKSVASTTMSSQRKCSKGRSALANRVGLQGTRVALTTATLDARATSRSTSANLAAMPSSSSPSSSLPSSSPSSLLPSSCSLPPSSSLPPPSSSSLPPSSSWISPPPLPASASKLNTRRVVCGSIL